MYRFFRRNREKVLKYLLIFFLGIVSLGMVITLAPLPQGDTSASPNVIASLGGVDVTTQDIRRRLDQQFRGSPLGNNPALLAQFAPNIVDEMVLEQATVLEARRMGLEVSDEELSDAIRAQFSSNGSFVGTEQYQNYVEQQTGMSVAQYESEVRQSLLTDKLKDVVTDAVQVTPDDVRREFVQRNEKAKIDYVLFKAADFTKDVNVTPEALQAYFATNRDRYKQPEQRSIRYALIDLDHVRPLVKVSDDELRSYYSSHMDQYRVPDRVKAAQILFKTEGKSAADVAKDKQTAQDVLDQIRKGADFAEIAKKYSQDTTAAQGGDLGWIQRGQTDKVFEDTAFSLQPGQVSGLVVATYGIHIIKVFDKQTAHLQTFDEVKGGIQAALEKQRLDQAQASLADQVVQALKADPQHFDAVAAKFNLQVSQTGLFKFKQPIPDLGVSEGLQNLVYQLTPNEVGQPVTLPKGVVIVQLAQDVPAHPATLDEVRAQVEQDYRNDQSRVLSESKAKELADKAKSGDFDKVAKSLGLTPKDSADFSRQGSVDNAIQASQLDQAFTLAPGQTSDVVTAGVNKVVFKVVSHTPADESAFAAQQTQIRQQLLDQKKALAWEIYRKNLKQELIRQRKLKINQDAMKQMLASYAGSNS